MHDSDPSLTSNEVFHYDLLEGPVHENDKGLLTHLKILRKEASKDGDVVFSLPDESRIWAHSLLFYIAAGEKLPSQFGSPRHLDPISDTVETATNGLGTDITVLYVLGDNQLAFEEAMSSCYTISSLTGAWRAMGYDAVGFKGKELDTSVPLTPTLPTSMLPDFEIQLKAPKSGRPLCSLKVHKFLLGRRVPYYETFFASGFSDAAGMTSTVYTEEFTAFSLWAVAFFIYHERPSVVFSSYPNLMDYITPSPVAPNQPPCCASYGPDRPIPDVGIAEKLLEVAKAAHYLQATNLEKWAYFFLCEVAHQFQCPGRGCSMFVPHILNLVVDSEITDRWIFKKGISLLAQHKSITAMWKRPLLNCKPSILELLIEEIQTDSEQGDEVGRTVLLFMKLSNLRRHTLKSKNSNDWERKLMVPLMDSTVEVIASKFNHPDVISAISAMFRGLNFSRPIAEELLGRIVDNKMLSEGNCRQVFVGIMTLARSCGSDEPQVTQAKIECITWFERKWLTLSLTPAPTPPGGPPPTPKCEPVDNQERGGQGNSVEASRSLSSHQRITPHASKEKEKVTKPLATTTGDERNFFSIWGVDELKELAEELLVTMSDLLATSHRKGPLVDDRYKPVRVRRDSSNAGRTVRGGTGSRRGGSASASGVRSASNIDANGGSSVVSSRQ